MVSRRIGEMDLGDDSMGSIKLQRISCAEPGASQKLADLRARLGAQGEVVSAKSRQLTTKVFGEALPPSQVVERICKDVRKEGLAAVLRYTEHFDRVRLDVDRIRVSAQELQEAHAAADGAYLELVRRVRQNILSFQFGLLHRDAVLTAPGYELRMRYRPLRRVGICVPGGAAAYPSTLLMTVCPAQAAGVKELVVVMPPGPFGADNPDLLATCRELGVSEVYRIGGAQAVAALAYGVQGISPVDMIVGPGNLFVTLAKRYVYGTVAIDMLAGPTELVVLADDSAVPEYVAADLIAQAEHSPGASLLISWHEPLFDRVETSLEDQLSELSRGELARDSLEAFGAFIQARDAREAVACANQIAPEHLHIATAQPEMLVDQIDNAGAIFLGHHTPVALGDYVAGPSHVLPTGGTARFASGLSANDFQRRSSVLGFTPPALEQMADDVCLLAEKEGLTGHAASVRVRKAEPPTDQAANGRAADKDLASAPR
jgi:histidinol dehydrogenase